MNIAVLLAIGSGFAMIAYAVYVILSSGEPGAEAKPNKRPGISPQEQKLASQEQKIQGLQEETNSLRLELEKTKADFAAAQNEFDSAKKKGDQLYVVAKKTGGPKAYYAEYLYSQSKFSYDIKL